jgi:hypothetical protein
MRLHPNSYVGPNTTLFNTRFSATALRLKEVNLHIVVDTLPGYETMTYAYLRYSYLLDDGNLLLYPILVCLSDATGSVWSCPDSKMLSVPSICTRLRGCTIWNT